MTVPPSTSYVTSQKVVAAGREVGAVKVVGQRTRKRDLPPAARGAGYFGGGQHVADSHRPLGSTFMGAEATAST